MNCFQFLRLSDSRTRGLTVSRGDEALTCGFRKALLHAREQFEFIVEDIGLRRRIDGAKPMATEINEIEDELRLDGKVMPVVNQPVAKYVRSTESRARAEACGCCRADSAADGEIRRPGSRPLLPERDQHCARILLTAPLCSCLCCSTWLNASPSNLMERWKPKKSSRRFREM